ncbi:MAG TPA: TlyA family RNA methyltransferase [Desulfobacteraceae bacterium]|mgnify:CR=1 FL=1|jgi:23S rRNA (cytidine1920-2'-O)/16S rRNA (cytidine1409-2'-O)-methyltransferase|nr:TlyA family RNA methyltransferase [Desulfobacteraceae bacterium]
MSETHPKKHRLDQLLVDRGLAPSRQKAKAMIMAGLVRTGDRRLQKPGLMIPESSELVVNTPEHSYVSRGGVKLAAALDYFSLSVEGKNLVDIGASTGGFTDCLLERGARSVIAVDVGYGQLDWKLRRHPRVKVMERTNARFLEPDHFQPAPDGAVIDVSFISLRLVVPSVSRILAENSFMVCLIKPQFEAGKGHVGKGGVVRDQALHAKIVESLETFFSSEGWAVLGTIPSPISGPKGNREFLCCMNRGNP